MIGLRALEPTQRAPPARVEVALRSAMSERGKILLVSSNFPPVTGGSATVYENLCLKGGGRVIALAARRDYITGQTLDYAAYDAAAGAMVQRVDLLRPLTPEATAGGGSKWRDLRLMATVLRRIIDICLKEKVRVVCLGDLVYGGWLAFPLRYMFGRKVVVYVHGEEITTESAGGLFDRQRGRFLAHAHGIVAVSRFTRDEIVRRMHVDPAKIELISNGVDLQKFVAAKRSSASAPAAVGPPGKRRLLTVGRLIPRKGFDRLIQAMPRLLERCPDAHLLVAGDGPQRGELEQLAADLQLTDHLTFLGRVSDDELNRLYEAAEVFALPNREMPDGDTEGFGLVFLEANAFGKPVVAGCAGGAVDAVTNGVNGLTVNGDSAVEVADAICRILLEPDLYRELSAGAAKVAGASDWPLRVRQFLDYCDGL